MYSIYYLCHEIFENKFSLGGLCVCIGRVVWYSGECHSLSLSVSLVQFWFYCFVCIQTSTHHIPTLQRNTFQTAWYNIAVIAWAYSIFHGRIALGGAIPPDHASIKCRNVMHQNAHYTTDSSQQLRYVFFHFLLLFLAFFVCCLWCSFYRYAPFFIRCSILNS